MKKTVNDKLCRYVKERATALKKSINSAMIYYDSRKRSLNLYLRPQKCIFKHAATVRSLRSWIFFSAFALFFRN